MQVMKFGAVSVSEAARLRDVVEIVKGAVVGDRGLVVVCTARPETTDMLINAARTAATGSEAQAEATRRELWNRHRALAEKLVADEWEREALYREWADVLKQFDRITRAIATLGEPSPRGIDAVAAVGERFIAHLLAVVLRQGGVAARMTDAAGLIVTNDHFGAAQVDPAESVARIHKRLSYLTQAGIVPVITGYIGATSEGVVTTLGRGGGDYSAALIGAALHAREVTIWTDVDGILTADPKLVPEARTLAELSYVEAHEIATFGAEVLHPRTLQPLVEPQIVLRLRDALHPDRAGTAISAAPNPARSGVRALISAPQLRTLKVVGPFSSAWSPALAARALTQLYDSGVEVLSFAQSFSERSTAITVRAPDAAFAHDCIASAFGVQADSGVIQEEPVALVAIITSGSGDVEPRVLGALGAAKTHLLALARATNGTHLSLIVPESELGETVRVIHSVLQL
ncbi:MAG: aspartate kinase [Roseiflexaceae bacterium]|nr:aspartate kinase [Roseiflexaceae bacterium]